MKLQICHHHISMNFVVNLIFEFIKQQKILSQYFDPNARIDNESTEQFNGENKQQ